MALEVIWLRLASCPEGQTRYALYARDFGYRFFFLFPLAPIFPWLTPRVDLAGSSMLCQEDETWGRFISRPLYVVCRC